MRRILKRIYQKVRSEGGKEEATAMEGALQDIDLDELNEQAGASGPSAFAIGAGRSGTHFMARLMQHDPHIYACHLDDVGKPVGDSFVLYCAWNGLPVDRAGFLAGRRGLICKASRASCLYFESNPYLAFSVLPLYEKFKSRFVFMMRSPEKVVNSHFVKGWYETPPLVENADLSLGYQYQVKRPNHFFGRIVPRGQEEYGRWKALSRIGKIAWMWNSYNLKILEQLEHLPDEQHMTVRLEEVNYERYRQVHTYVGGTASMKEETFREIREAKPGKAGKLRTAASWSMQERREFEDETEEARQRLGYD